MKPLKKVTDIGENEGIHCKTEKEAKEKFSERILKYYGN